MMGKMRDVKTHMIKMANLSLDEITYGLLDLTVRAIAAVNSNGAFTVSRHGEERMLRNSSYSVEGIFQSADSLENVLLTLHQNSVSSCPNHRFQSVKFTF